MATRLAVLGLYRDMLRTAQRFPISVQVRNKLMFNTKLMFRIRKQVRDPERIQKLIKDARHDLSVLGKLNTQNPEVLLKIFRKGESVSAPIHM